MHVAGTNWIGSLEKLKLQMIEEVAHSHWPALIGLASFYRRLDSQPGQKLGRQPAIRHGRFCEHSPNTSKMSATFAPSTVPVWNAARIFFERYSKTAYARTSQGYSSRPSQSLPSWHGENNPDRREKRREEKDDTSSHKPGE